MIVIFRKKVINIWINNKIHNKFSKNKLIIDKTKKKWNNVKTEIIIDKMKKN